MSRLVLTRRGRRAVTVLQILAMGALLVIGFAHDGPVQSW